MKKIIPLLISALILIILEGHAQQKKEIVYVGTYSVRGSEGIYVYEFDRVKGTLKQIQTINDLSNPTFLEIHPSGKFLYSVNRGATQEMEKSGSVSAFSIDSKTGNLKFLNHKPSYGAEPCHISIDQTGKLAFVSNYVEGNIAVLPIQANGLLSNLSDIKNYSGSSINAARQEKPHAHSAMISPDNRFLYVSDLGTDKINIYNIDITKGKINPADQPFASVSPGAGPRHFAFHPNGRYAYSAEELTSSVGAFALNNKDGSLRIIKDTIKSLPQDFKHDNTSADIHIEPQGKYLYMSNRGLNALAIFSIANDGDLKLLDQQTTMGERPRNFLIDKKGEYVFVAHQDTDNITIFKLDKQTGKLTYTRNQVRVPSPVCIKMLNIN